MRMPAVSTPTPCLTVRTRVCGPRCRSQQCRPRVRLNQGQQRSQRAVLQQEVSCLCRVVCDVSEELGRLLGRLGRLRAGVIKHAHKNGHNTAGHHSHAVARRAASDTRQLTRTHAHTHTHPRSEPNKTKKIAFLRFTCQDGARHSYWIVKNLFCFCVKGRSFQGVNVSEL